jgi:integrase/recombinase XerD
MTHLRKMMLEELERRNYAQATIHCYLRAVTEFSLHFHRPPNQLGPEHIRQYQAHLFGRQKLAPSTVTQRLAALRFFYVKTLRKPWSITETPYPKKVQRLPIILSSDANLDLGSQHPMNRTLFGYLHQSPLLVLG